MIVTFFNNHYHKHISLEVIKKEKEKIERSLDKSIVKLQSMNAFENDTQLRDAAIEWFVHYKKSFDIDYEELIPILVKVDKTEGENMRLNEIQNRLFKEEDELDHNFLIAHTNFTQKHHLVTQSEEDQTSLLNR